MDDLSPTDAHELTVTDYAYPFEPIALYASADFNLRDYNASVKTFYPGQQGLQGSSGHDSEYKQIAKLDGYGTIYDSKMRPLTGTTDCLLSGAYDEQPRRKG